MKNEDWLVTGLTWLFITSPLWGSAIFARNKGGSGISSYIDQKGIQRYKDGKNNDITMEEFIHLGGVPIDRKPFRGGSGTFSQRKRRLSRKKSRRRSTRRRSKGKRRN